MWTAIMLITMAISLVVILLFLGKILSKDTETHRERFRENERKADSIAEVVSEEADNTRKLYALVDSVIEEQLNCYYARTKVAVDSDNLVQTDYEVMDYDLLKDSLSLSEYRSALVIQARKIGMIFSNEVLITNAVKSLESDYPITKYIKQSCHKLPVDYRTVKGHKYVTLRYALQYEKGSKMAQEIEGAIKAKEEVERFLVEKNKQ